MEASSEPSTITAIEQQVRDRNRVSVFVDGEFALGVHAEVAAAVGLRVGQVVTLADLQALVSSEERRCIRDRALRLLGFRARSRRELEQRLLRKGHTPELVTETLDALARSGLLDDAEFSRAWVRARTQARPMGPSRIAAELRRKGVDRELIEDALQPVDADRELALALDVARQKLDRVSGLDPREARRKLSALLIRRGFSWDVTNKALRTLLADEE